MIPKIIHYCWFGDFPLKEEYIAYINEWKEFNPGYKVKEWNIENIPLGISYLEVAVAQKKWANVSNYIRLFALRNEGGIYLDTDMKLLGSLDSLLNYQCFLGFESGNADSTEFWVNNAIMGSVPNHKFVKECEQVLLETCDGTEKANLSAPHLITDILKKRYNLRKYKSQLLTDIMLFEKDVFYPLPYEKAFLRKDRNEWGVTPNTLAIHMWGRSWFSQEMLIEIIDFHQRLKIEQENTNTILQKRLDISKENLNTKITEITALLSENQQLRKYLTNIEELKANLNNQFCEFNKELSLCREMQNNYQHNLDEFLLRLKDLQSEKEKHSLHLKAISDNQHILLSHCESLSQSLLKLDSIYPKLNILTSLLLELKNEQKKEVDKNSNRNAELLEIRATSKENTMLLQTLKTDIQQISVHFEDNASSSNQALENLTKYVIFIYEGLKNRQAELYSEIKALKEKNQIQSYQVDNLTKQSSEQNKVIADYKKQYEESGILKLLLKKLLKNRTK